MADLQELLLSWAAIHADLLQNEVSGLEGGLAVQSVMPHLAAGSIIMSERSLMNLWIEQVSVLHTGEW